MENVDERHIKTATWVFPLDLLLINIFVLPIAIAGLVTFGSGGVSADAFVLALPLADQQAMLTLFVFIGVLSAATGMVIVETIALSTMVSNSLVLPILLRRRNALADGRDLGRAILRIRRATIVAVLLLGYAYFRVAGDALALVSIGLISFAAVAQFAPAIVGGHVLAERDQAGRDLGPAGRIRGVGLHAAAAVAGRDRAGPRVVRRRRPLRGGTARPLRVVRLDGLDEVSHSMLWSMLVNVGLFVGLSLTGRREPAEHALASAFVTHSPMSEAARAPGGVARPPSGNCGCSSRASLATTAPGQRSRPTPRAPAPTSHPSARRSPNSSSTSRRCSPVRSVPRLRGSSSAPWWRRNRSLSTRCCRSSTTPPRCSPTAGRSSASRSSCQPQLPQLRHANERLQELDRLKDDFVSTVTHELRTPLTSIRAFSEILSDNPDLDPAERGDYLRIVVQETERLTRLINQVLDLSKLESGGAQWHIEPVDLGEVVTTSAQATAQIFREREVDLEVDMPGSAPIVRADRDRLVQVLLNLLSNAVKFCPRETGRVQIGIETRDAMARVDVRDNGPGIADADREVIFEKFRQGGDTRINRPAGTGLGLPISRQIVEHLGGRLWVESLPGEGATFSFTLPVAVVGAGSSAGAEATEGET